MFAHGPRAAMATLVTVPTLMLVGSTAYAATTEAGDRADDRKHSQRHHSDEGDKRRKDDKAGRRDGEGVEPGTLKGGTLIKLGWWARTNEPPPETGLLAPPSVPALAAPKGTLPVAQVAGESERITALEFAIKGKTDGTVRSVKLALRESEDPSSNPNSAAGVVTACPITETFWVGVENGPWATRPTYDCGVGAVQGKRDDAGVWHFNLTPLATDWLAADRQYAPAVMLVGTPAQTGEAAAPPDPGSANFQVAFDAEKGIGLVAKTKAPAKSDGQGDSGTGDDVDAGTGSGTGSGGGTAGGGLGSVGGGGGLGEAPVDSAPVAGGEVDTTDAADAPAATQPTAVAPVSAGPLPWHSGIGPRFLLLLPALVLAYLLMLAMGPAGQPVGGQRTRGVSRALDRLRPAAATAGGTSGAGRTTS